MSQAWIYMLCWSRFDAVPFLAVGSHRRTTYFGLAGLVFVALVIIETQLDSGFIRFTVGDVLVVVFLYSVLMSITRWQSAVAAGVSLGVSFAVEISQALDLVDRVGLKANRLTDVVLGNTFAWSDLVAYTAGAALSWAFGRGVQRLAAGSTA